MNQQKKKPESFNPFSADKDEEPLEKKKPMIVMMKEKPENVESMVSEETGKLIVKITVEQENSAANIDLDISATELKLTSEK